jgi:uncharacterized membrane protein
MLANVILVIHFVIVLLIVAGLPAIYAGATLGWQWVRNWHWRALHLGAIVFVSVESLVAIACPLTLWEDASRGQRPGLGFVERWIHRLMFYDLPTWVFTGAYVVFAALVIVAWIRVPPTRYRHANGR